MTDQNPLPPVPLSYLDPGDGRRIAIRHRAATQAMPTVVFLPGYASDMEGEKASAIDAYCAARGAGCLRLDYSGTGSSAGNFADGTMGRWLDEVLAAIDMAVPTGDLIVAGSSMGGWLAVHAALRRKDRVKGLLGIAAAPDFTDWGYSDEERAAIVRDGRIDLRDPNSQDVQTTHEGFWRSGEAFRLLWNPIDLPIPVRFVHGLADHTVPIGVPLKLIDQLHSSDVQIRFIKGGGHRLSEPHEIHAILVELYNLVELIR
ncbi:alpha/beta hydrolase [Sphingomonas sp. ASV193]|uniref:alpha/beta hydrolase n=1 Tax=Sphingomonas sp. ASV193 TaxID=3144405 RepID=UPI0032E8CD50